MSDELVYYDLEFKFSSGRELGMTLLDGRDVIDDNAEYVRVTRYNENGTETTVTIHREKLDAVESTKRTEKPTPHVKHGDTILELS